MIKKRVSQHESPDGNQEGPPRSLRPSVLYRLLSVFVKFDKCRTLLAELAEVNNDPHLFRRSGSFRINEDVGIVPSSFRIAGVESVRGSELRPDFISGHSLQGKELTLRPYVALNGRRLLSARSEEEGQTEEQCRNQKDDARMSLHEVGRLKHNNEEQRKCQDPPDATFLLARLLEQSRPVISREPLPAIRTPAPVQMSPVQRAPHPIRPLTCRIS